MDFDLAMPSAIQLPMLESEVRERESKGLHGIESQSWSRNFGIKRVEGWS